jgi:hypothetical protein
MIWPFKLRSRAEKCPTIGQYKINSTIEEIQGLKPLSVDELAALNPILKFEDEQIWHAPEAEFLSLK